MKKEKAITVKVFVIIQYGRVRIFLFYEILLLVISPSDCLACKSLSEKLKLGRPRSFVGSHQVTLWSEAERKDTSPSRAGNCLKLILAQTLRGYHSLQYLSFKKGFGSLPGAWAILKKRKCRGALGNFRTASHIDCSILLWRGRADKYLQILQWYYAGCGGETLWT